MADTGILLVRYWLEVGPGEQTPLPGEPHERPAEDLEALGSASEPGTLGCLASLVTINTSVLGFIYFYVGRAVGRPSRFRLCAGL
jgi:hypothetical protein